MSVVWTLNTLIIRWPSSNFFKRMFDLIILISMIRGKSWTVHYKELCPLKWCQIYNFAIDLPLKRRFFYIAVKEKYWYLAISGRCMNRNLIPHTIDGFNSFSIQRGSCPMRLPKKGIKGTLELPKLWRLGSHSYK